MRRFLSGIFIVNLIFLFSLALTPARVLAGDPPDGDDCEVRAEKFGKRQESFTGTALSLCDDIKKRGWDWDNRLQAVSLIKDATVMLAFRKAVPTRCEKHSGFVDLDNILEEWFEELQDRCQGIKPMTGMQDGVDLQ